MEIILQAGISGLAQGCVYALVALGFVLIYKATEVASFAQGELMMIGAYIHFTLVTGLGIPSLAALPFTLVLAGLLGALIERVVVHPLADEEPFILIALTIGLAVFLRAMTGLIWSHDTHPFPSPVPEVNLAFGGAVLTTTDLWAFGVTAFVTVTMFAFFRWTRVGTAMRAIAQNRYAAQLMGIRVQHLFTLTWALAAAVAALGGVVLADQSLLHTNMGFIGLVAIPAAVLGGLESIPGALLGGLAIGLIESMVGIYIGATLKDISPYFILLAVLLFRPTGLFGLPDTKRA